MFAFLDPALLDQYPDGVERVEKEMRLELSSKRLQLRAAQSRLEPGCRQLLSLEPLLDFTPARPRQRTGRRQSVEKRVLLCEQQDGVDSSRLGRRQMTERLSGQVQERRMRERRSDDDHPQAGDLSKARALFEQHFDRQRCWDPGPPGGHLPSEIVEKPRRLLVQRL